MSQPIIDVAEGKLKGKACQTENGFQYFTFKGIPYAKPPVDGLRFAAPQPPSKWQEVRDATLEPNICCQLNKETGGIEGSEDCLYLNVSTPKLPTAGAAPLPVMFYIHGGGFLFGNGTGDKEHTPNYMVEKDVVVVIINYRIGILGFLNLDRKEATGNMGLRDVVQALKWVKINISKFNGDPDNVTIFGISAGGATVEYLLLSPMGKGLFHKAIAQSGSSLCHWAYSENVKKLAHKIAALRKVEINNDQELYDYLKKLPSKDLVAASMEAITSETKGNIFFGFVPSIEKPVDWEPFLDQIPYKMLKEGSFTKVPLITGFTSHEGLLMACIRQSDLDELVEKKKLIDYLPLALDEREVNDVSNKLNQIYLDEGKYYKNPSDFAIDFFTDVDFLGPVYVSTSLISENSSPVYFYEFAYDGGLNYLKNKFNVDRRGACHGDEGGYLINAQSPKTVSDTDLNIRERMLKMWTNFAKFGNPTPTDDSPLSVQWEPVTSKGVEYLEISEQVTMKGNLHPQRMKLFQELYGKRFG